MSRSLGRKPIAYDQRTGRKVRYDDLVEDGEIKGLRVHWREADQDHPLNYPVVIGPDRTHLRRPAPEAKTEDRTAWVGDMADPNDLSSKLVVPPFIVEKGAGVVIYVAVVLQDNDGYGDEGYGIYVYGGAVNVTDAEKAF